MRVPRFACQRRHVVRTEAIEERMGRRPLHENLAHVTHVEQADGAAHREMLVDDSRILEGHLPSAELDHARPAARCHSNSAVRNATWSASRAPMKAFAASKAYGRPPHCPRPPWACSGNSATS